VLPYDAIENVIVTSCPPEFRYLANHPYCKRIFWEGSLFDERYRHFSRHFEIRRDGAGNLVYRGLRRPRGPSYVRMRLDQLCY
jgi:hypothetical protein